MKRSLHLAIVAALVSLPAFAANSKTITISDAVTVGSTKLPAGDYKVSWTGTAPNVQLTIEQKTSHKPTIATVPATLSAQKNDQTQILTNNHAGVVELESIQLKDVTLKLASSPASGQ